jgi:hypothetical protein
MEFEEKIQAFWEKVQAEYADLVKEDGIFPKTNYYVFQTKPSFNPDLMIVGINPGGNGYTGDYWLSPANGENLYVLDAHPWFERLRHIFGYPQNVTLKPFLENCVGSNSVFINTGNASQIPKNIPALGPNLIRELVSDIIKPNYILTLGNDTFYGLRNGKVAFQEFGQIKLKYSYRNGTPVCYIPNPSRINSRYFNNGKIEDWQKALEWFFTLPPLTQACD